MLRWLEVSSLDSHCHSYHCLSHLVRLATCWISRLLSCPRWSFLQHSFHPRRIASVRRNSKFDQYNQKLSKQSSGEIMLERSTCWSLLLGIRSWQEAPWPRKRHIFLLGSALRNCRPLQSQDASRAYRTRRDIRGPFAGSCARRKTSALWSWKVQSS